MGFERCCAWIGHRGWLLLELLLELLLSVLLSERSSCPEVGVLPCPVAPLLTVSECASTPTSI